MHKDMHTTCRHALAYITNSVFTITHLFLSYHRDRSAAVALSARCVLLEELPADVTVLELSECFSCHLKSTSGFVRLRLLDDQNVNTTAACIEFKSEEECESALVHLRTVTFRNAAVKAFIRKIA